MNNIDTEKVTQKVTFLYEFLNNIIHKLFSRFTNKSIGLAQYEKILILGVLRNIRQVDFSVYASCLRFLKCGASPHSPYPISLPEILIRASKQPVHSSAPSSIQGLFSYS